MPGPQVATILLALAASIACVHGGRFRGAYRLWGASQTPRRRLHSQHSCGDRRGPWGQPPRGSRVWACRAALGRQRPALWVRNWPQGKRRNVCGTQAAALASWGCPNRAEAWRREPQPVWTRGSRCGHLCFLPRPRGSACARLSPLPARPFLSVCPLFPGKDARPPWHGAHSGLKRSDRITRSLITLAETPTYEEGHGLRARWTQIWGTLSTPPSGGGDAPSG